MTDTSPAGQPLRGLPGWSRADDRAAYGHSPHLSQWRLRQRLLRLVRETLSSPSRTGPRVLELGAGHGCYAGELLAAGADVTLVELSPQGLGDAERLHRDNPRFRGLLDPDVHLGPAVADGGPYDVALVLSVLHHVPDYLAMLDRLLPHLAPGADLVTVQDPLWYRRCNPQTRRVDRAAYLAWRVGQGQVGAGLRSAARRARGEPPPHGGGELSYYHVVREGVDEQSVAAMLRPHFESLDLIGYWSNHLALVAPVAEWAGWRNTFAVRARGYRG